MTTKMTQISQYLADYYGVDRQAADAAIRTAAGLDIAIALLDLDVMEAAEEIYSLRLV